ncbi:MAG: propionyl-CoA carboxylase alpha chain [Solirubrobacteraceae bacterium]|nr:propionyl-CoA carboxylase alpha chain [Solirubrobacteraceae bacterium]
MNRLLVANRGEIARRVFATCRRLGISTAAVYAPPDADAMFVREADVAVALGGEPMAYLDGAAVVAAALRVGADGIHPGYGFLAENAGFAQAVLDAGLTWVGPSPEAIAAMGSKTEARTRMEAAGVPVLTEGADHFPLMVKASAGGGGKGMRLVERREDLDAAVEAAKREALNAFGDDTVFLERYLARARHVEIQIVGDSHGRVVAFGERDCSVQRRHQKVVEEAPSPAVDPALRQRMADAAVAAGEAIGYVGAGTVEFLLDGSDFYFLEVNTRLQVEHPVTELVTGVDLVELQLRVATGEPVPDAPPLSGHAIEVRLYAEDPANDFLPVTGTLARFGVAGDVRVDTGVESGSVISPYYDPMIAKVIVHAPTRAEAARRLADALARAELHGMTTNRDFLVNVLRHPEFVAGDADTGFLERHDCSAPLLDSRARGLCAAAHALAGQAARRAGESLPSGWRNNPSQLQQVSYEGVEVGYRFDRSGSLAALEIDGEPVGAVLHACTPERVDLEIDGVRRTYLVAPGAVNTADGQADLVELPRFADPLEAAHAGSLMSPMPGTVLRVLVEEGASVELRQPLLVLEAMKMEHEIVAPGAGVVSEMRVAAGAQVETGTVLVVIDAPDAE